MVDDFGKKVQGGNHKFELHVFDADHAFANPSNSKYDVSAATQAETFALKFLKNKLELE